MTTQPDRQDLTQATLAAQAVLAAAGVDIARVTSDPVTGGGYPDGTIRTDVQLDPHHDPERVIAALRALPHLVDLWSADGLVAVLRNPHLTNFGPGGRDGLTVREAVRQSRLIHPEWPAATHVDWLVEDGYRLDHLDRAAVQATVAGWLAAEPLPQLPPGARLLSADEAVDALVAGDHPSSRHGGLDLDGALIDGIRNGQILACRLADGQIAFTRLTA